jgi:hypothetical protein
LGYGFMVVWCGVGVMFFWLDVMCGSGLRVKEPKNA